MKRNIILLSVWLVAGLMPLTIANAEEGKPESATCPFGVCMGASINDFVQKAKKRKACEGRMCLVRDVPSPSKSFKDYSVVFTTDGKACGVIASFQTKSRREVLELWSYEAMYYTERYGTERAFDEKTMTIIWNRFQDGVNEDIRQVVLTIGGTNGVYLLTDFTSFNNIEKCQ